MKRTEAFFDKQLKRATEPSGALNVDALRTLVTDSYYDYERDRDRTDRSITLMVEENDQLTRDLRANLAELSVERARFESAIEHMSIGLSLFDATDRLVVANARFREIYGLQDSEVPADCSLFDLCQLLVRTRRVPGIEDARALSAFIRRLKNHRKAKHEWTMRNGKVVALTLFPVRGGGWNVLHEDVTEQRRAMTIISEMARHDALTGLPNRLQFRETLHETLQNNRRTAVLCLDLDGFKEVNDTFGHPMGDKLLFEVAGRMKACLGAQDFISRLGGDEFAIVHSGFDHDASGEDLGERLIAAVTEPFVISGQRMKIGTSIGLAFTPEAGSDVDAVLKSADLALYAAKSGGGYRVCRFEQEMGLKELRRRQLSTDLRLALAQEQLELHYQPLVDPLRNAICGFEALLRWRHPARGLVPPLDFIPLAEETGLIVPIGEWVIRKACEEAAKWPAGVKVSVNVSPIQFESRSLALTIAAALGQSGLAPHRLEIEITEAVFLKDSALTLEILNHLKTLGVQVAIDDFGTGYSSLGYLQKFPCGRLKIDRSFTSKLGTCADASSIIRAIVLLGKSFGMETSVEGIETREQLDVALAQGCNEMQGYLFGKPLPSAEALSLMQKAPPVSTSA